MKRCLAVLAVVCAACGGSATPGPDASVSSDPRSLAQGYARDDLTCTKDDECCIVFDGCLTEGLVVAAKDRTAVADLLARASKDTCTSCLNPALQARCQAGYCTGKYLQEGSSDAGTCDFSSLQTFMTDHCGLLTVPAGCVEVTPKVGQSLRVSCGGGAK